MAPTPQQLTFFPTSLQQQPVDWSPDTPSSHTQSSMASRPMSPPDTLVDLATSPATSTADWLSPVSEGAPYGKQAASTSPQPIPALPATSGNQVAALSPKSVSALPLPMPNQMPPTTSASGLLPDPLAPAPDAPELSSTYPSNSPDQNNQLLSMLLGQNQANNVLPAAISLAGATQAPIPPAPISLGLFSSPESVRSVTGGAVSPLPASNPMQANDEVNGPWQESLATVSPLDSITQPPCPAPTLATATDPTYKPFMAPAMALSLNVPSPTPVAAPQSAGFNPWNLMWPSPIPSTQPPSLADASSLGSESSVLESPPSLMQEPRRTSAKPESRPTKQHAKTKKSARGRPTSKRGGDPAVTRFPCPECGKEFNRHYNLVAHKVMHDPNHPRPFVCPATFCKKAFARKYDACRHYRQLHILRDGSPPEWIERIADARRVQPTTA